MATENPHFPRHHRLSPSFTDSAIDVELTEITESNEITPSAHTVPFANRLSRIAHLAAQNSFQNLDLDERTAVDKHLNDLEELFDPRPCISREIAKNRPSSSSTEAVTPIASPLSLARGRKDDVLDNRTIEQTSRRLTTLLEELSRVNAELQQRRIEAHHIHDLFTLKCEGMAQRIIELEDEVHDLQSDIVEDTIELEGLRGTVRGLESWINRWQRQREIVVALGSSLSPEPKSNRWRREKQHTNKDFEDETDFDTLLDGISAWMRGWNDVEEGFRVRARRRKMRRDRRSNPVIRKG